jgi:hypothetical protein
MSDSGGKMKHRSEPSEKKDLKWFLPDHTGFFSIENEEEWLRNMSKRGLHLVSAGWWKHGFERGEPNEYNYKVERLTNNPQSGESRKYIEFMEGTGAEYVGSRGRWAYFRKRSDLGEFDLFSDIDSRIEHLCRQINWNRTIIVLSLSIISIGYYAAAYGPFEGNSAVLLCPVFFTVIFVYRHIILQQRKRKLETKRILHE